MKIEDFIYKVDGLRLKDWIFRSLFTAVFFSSFFALESNKNLFIFLFLFGLAGFLIYGRYILFLFDEKIVIQQKRAIGWLSTTKTIYLEDLRYLEYRSTQKNPAIQLLAELTPTAPKGGYFIFYLTDSRELLIESPVLNEESELFCSKVNSILKSG